MSERVQAKRTPGHDPGERRLHEDTANAGRRATGPTDDAEFTPAAAVFAPGWASRSL